MKTNVLLLGLVLALLCILAGAWLLGGVFFGVAVALFLLRNGMLRR